ncbi:sugar ABC transporter permease [Georgenia sp. TF02-10]|uniref:carbohydrate ABC transporter permease n=1 Tax=Georgenia sp. TF02-10 TaxID=2917725 RepID=UPI001FA744D9|nr:sugar ABC transporter permease [Georgenia sp. TF02-10]UNX54256.1 sugar ABC transporter permease [Georgenia sp. TF02-10]
MATAPAPAPRAAAPGAAAPPAGPVTPVRPRRRRALLPYLLLAPAIGILLLGTGYPVLWQLLTSLRTYGVAQQFGQPAPFVGLANYAAIVADADLWGVIVRSVVFCIVTALVTVALGLGLALLMRAVWNWARVTLQVALLLAWAMPVIAAMTVWIWLFDRRRGVVNWLLETAGLEQFHRFDWLSQPLTFFAVASVIVVWMSVPFVALSVYAGLTQVSTEVLEASAIDGASPRQRLRYIILPMIRPVIMIVLLLQLVWDLRVFTQVRMLQDAGSATSAFDLLGTAIYKLGTGTSNFGTAAALSVFILALTLVMSAYYVRALLKEDQE